MLAESFFKYAQSSALLETKFDSAATALVLDHYADFLFNKGRAIEAESCAKQARLIVCAYAPELLVSLEP